MEDSIRQEVECIFRELELEGAELFGAIWC